MNLRWPVVRLDELFLCPRQVRWGASAFVEFAQSYHLLVSTRSSGELSKPASSEVVVPLSAQWCFFLKTVQGTGVTRPCAALHACRQCKSFEKGVLLFQHSSFEDMSESETRYLTWIRNKIETDGRSYTFTQIRF